MNSNPAPAEVFQPPNPDTARPAFLLFEGDGGAVRGEDAGQPDFSIAADHASPGSMETEQSADVPTEAADDSGTRKKRIAAQAGIASLRVIRVNAKRSPESSSPDQEGHRRKSGGGSWIIREHLKKLAAEAKEKAKAEARSHKDDCNCDVCNPKLLAA